MSILTLRCLNFSSGLWASILFIKVFTIVGVLQNDEIEETDKKKVYAKIIEKNVDKESKANAGATLCT